MSFIIRTIKSEKIHEENLNVNLKSIDNTNVTTDENNNNEKACGKQKGKYRSTIILCDSMLKDIEPYKMRLAVSKSEKVYIKSFVGGGYRIHGTLHVRPKMFW